MKNTKLIRFVEAFLVLPALTIGGVPVGNNVGVISQTLVTIVAPGDSIKEAQVEKEEELKVNKIKAEAIDAYFKARNMPLAGTGMKMVLEAEKNDLDWRLLPAIAVRESTGGKHACKKVENSFFGWGSCKIGFNSTEEAIEIVAHNLGGNNPKTARHYGDKTIREMLQAYNPPSIVPRYAEQVIAIMNAIGDAEIVQAPLAMITK